jgi:hypothetical protein
MESIVSCSVYCTKVQQNSEGTEGQVRRGIGYEEHSFYQHNHGRIYISHDSEVALFDLITSYKSFPLR